MKKFLMKFLLNFFPCSYAWCISYPICKWIFGILNSCLIFLNVYEFRKTFTYLAAFLCIKHLMYSSWWCNLKLLLIMNQPSQNLIFHYKISYFFYFNEIHSFVFKCAFFKATSRTFVVLSCILQFGLESFIYQHTTV